MIHSIYIFFSSVILPLVVNFQFELQIRNIQNLEGTIYVAVYNNEEDFPIDNRWKFRTAQKVTKNSELFKIYGLDMEECAIAIFHDVNGNGKMDKNLLGIPKEPFGFSNNIRPKFSPPDFKDCLVKVDEQGTLIEIDLIHKIFF